MAVGFAKDGAEQLEVQAVVDAAINHARKQLHGVNEVSRTHCLDCAESIPERRREALRGVQYCIECQNEHDTVFKRDPRNCWHRSMR